MGINLPAGRELDALVAERVMGFKVKMVGEALLIETAQPVLENLPPYSTDIAAAFQVWERLKCEGKHSNLHWDQVEEIWQMDFSGDWANAETAPHAICLAALKTRGYRV